MDNEKVKSSILLTVKHAMGGLDEEETFFDPDIIMYLNSQFMVLAQLGVGPVEPFKVEDADTEWSEFECNDLEGVKEYLTLRTKLVFDPPLNGTVMQAHERRIDELTWRLNVFSEEIKDGE